MGQYDYSKLKYNYVYESYRNSSRFKEKKKSWQKMYLNEYLGSFYHESMRPIPKSDQCGLFILCYSQEGREECESAWICGRRVGHEGNHLPEVEKERVLIKSPATYTDIIPTSPYDECLTCTKLGWKGLTW